MPGINLLNAGLGQDGAPLLGVGRIHETHHEEGAPNRGRIVFEDISGTEKTTPANEAIKRVDATLVRRGEDLKKLERVREIFAEKIIYKWSRDGSSNPKEFERYVESMCSPQVVSGAVALDSNQKISINATSTYIDCMSSLSGNPDLGVDIISDVRNKIVGRSARCDGTEESELEFMEYIAGYAKYVKEPLAPQYIRLMLSSTPAMAIGMIEHSRKAHGTRELFDGTLALLAGSKYKLEKPRIELGGGRSDLINGGLQRTLVALDSVFKNGSMVERRNAERQLSAIKAFDYLIQEEADLAKGSVCRVLNSVRDPEIQAYFIDAVLSISRKPGGQEAVMFIGSKVVGMSGNKADAIRDIAMVVLTLECGDDRYLLRRNAPDILESPKE